MFVDLQGDGYSFVFFPDHDLLGQGLEGARYGAGIRISLGAGEPPMEEVRLLAPLGDGHNDQHNGHQHRHRFGGGVVGVGGDGGWGLGGGMRVYFLRPPSFRVWVV